MLVFRYDKSFDGLLSALFDAYSMRAFPEALIGPGEPEPLFTERVHDVATDEAHAGRVWRGLERRLTARTRSMFVYAWHGEQPQGDLLMLRCLRRVFDEGGGVVADQADPDMKSLFQLALKVSHERERLKQFVRLQKAADGTYFAAVTPEHDALPLAVDYFTDRFADQRWLIYDRRRDCGYYYDGHTARCVTLEDDRGMIADKLADEWLATGRFVESDGALYAACADRGSDITIDTESYLVAWNGDAGEIMQTIPRREWNDETGDFVPVPGSETYYAYPFITMNRHAVFSAFPCPY